MKIRIVRVLVIALLSFVILCIVAVTFLVLSMTVFGNSISASPLPSTLSYESKEVWEGDRPRILREFENHIYGPLPRTHTPLKVEKRVLDERAFNGKGVFELWTLTSEDNAFTLHVVALFPHNDTPSPLLITSNFCPNHVRFKDYVIPKPLSYPSFCDEESMEPFTHFIFGTYIDTFPYEELLDRGIATGFIYLAEGVPDEETLGRAALEKLSAYTKEPVTGVLAAWAWEYLEVLKAFEQDSRIDERRTALYGHSRDGKSALLAAAASDEVDLVWVHQSGKGGASLWRHPVGEPTDSLLASYSYWFSPTLAQYSGNEERLPVDQHMLIALVAPRPVLISHAYQDVWGDPEGAFMAAREASRIYNLYGSSGLSATRLDEFIRDDTIAFFMRPWFHGVQPSDWDAFFAFTEVHF